MKTSMCFAAAVLLLLTALAGDEGASTPKPGSPERTAICDALRAYARTQYQVDPKLRFLWKIDWIRLQGKYAAFSGFAVNPDGSYLEDDSAIGDFEMTACLVKQEAGWEMLMDLSRGDVPSADEIGEIRSALPRDFPLGILPEFWRKTLAPPPEPAGIQTPEVGSAERKAICDGMRDHVRDQYEGLENQKFLWKIENLRVLGNYSVFEGSAVNPDGSHFEHESMIGDWLLTAFLRRDPDGWQVIGELPGGGDPPAEAEIAAIRETFPKEIPTALIPDYWRGKLR